MGWGESSWAGWFFKMAAKSLWLPAKPVTVAWFASISALAAGGGQLGLPDKGDAVEPLPHWGCSQISTDLACNKERTGLVLNI